MIGQMETVFPYAYWHDQDPLHHPGHNVAGWFKQNQQITVPSRDLGWHLAQGWIQVGAPVDDPNNPPEKIYTLTKDVLDSTAVLADLISDYTTAFNEGREANDQRYDDLVVMYNDTLLKTHKHLNRAAAANNSYETLFLTSLSTIISQTDYYLNAMKVGALETFDQAGAALNEFAATLTKLGTGYDAYAAAVATVLADQGSALDQFTGRTTTLLANLGDDYTTLNGVLDDIVSDVASDLSSYATSFTSKLNELAGNVATTQGHLLTLVGEVESLLDGHASDVSGHIAAYGSKLDELESNVNADVDDIVAVIEEAESVLETYRNQMASHISAYEIQMDKLDANVTAVEATFATIVSAAYTAYQTYRTELLSLTASSESELSNLKSDVSGLLTELNTTLATHSATYQGIVDLFASDWTTHAATTRALLVDLGTSELDRINEQFDNLLVRNRQMLMSRGLYKSALTPIIDAQVERERAMAIADLNDRLAREQVEHEHRLYGEHANVRDRQAQGEQYLFSLRDMAIKYRAQWSERLYLQAVGLYQTIGVIHGSIRDANQFAISQESQIEDRLHGWRQEAVKAIADGKERVFQIRGLLHDAHQRILGQESQIRVQFHGWKQDAARIAAEGLDRVQQVRKALFDAQQSAVGQEMQIRDQLHNWTQEGVVRVAEGMERIQQFRDASSRWQAQVEASLADFQRAIHGMSLDVYGRELSGQFDASKFSVSVRESILDRLNGFIASYADGVSKYASTTLDAGKFLASVRQAAIADHLKTRFQYCSGLNDANAAQVKMYQYQLDTRNNLAVALFGFMERRTDEYPDINRMGELAMGLGDAGATQVIQP